MDQLLGVVLCGGESRRMGKDKGLLPVGNTIWALSAAGKLTPFGIPLIFSINERQVENYSACIPRDQLVIDIVEKRDALAGLADVRGPLKGLLSVHRRFPGSSLLLLACDMLHLDEHTIQKIITAYREESGYDFYVYQDLQFAQPFCGIYTSQGLDKADVLALHSGSHDFSLQSLLNKANTRRLTIDRPEAFRNYNSL
ncbi:MAG TPA: molybdenum cofactor guanylyltransferase [Puia sp.]|nr:molybdenum cofactor guanylyltransferase [Puia sp.]